MKINELNQRPGIDKNVKLEKVYLQLERLLDELRKMIKKKQTRIIKLLEKELKVVLKNYYRNLWLSIGIAVFGVPIGVTFGTSIGDMAFLGAGLPIGLAIGIAVGAAMDKKALKEGRQIDLEIKY